ncbi:MAG: hypothetical protein AB7O38_18305 [Pirellulaceae bacterium]
MRTMALSAVMLAGMFFPNISLQARETKLPNVRPAVLANDQARGTVQTVAHPRGRSYYYGPRYGYRPYYRSYRPYYGGYYRSYRPYGYYAPYGSYYGGYGGYGGYYGGPGISFGFGF